MNFVWQVTCSIIFVGNCGCCKAVGTVNAWHLHWEEKTLGTHIRIGTSISRCCFLRVDGVAIQRNIGTAPRRRLPKEQTMTASIARKERLSFPSNLGFKGTYCHPTFEISTRKKTTMRCGIQRISEVRPV